MEKNYLQERVDAIKSQHDCTPGDLKNLILNNLDEMVYWIKVNRKKLERDIPLDNEDWKKVAHPLREIMNPMARYNEYLHALNEQDF